MSAQSLSDTEDQNPMIQPEKVVFNSSFLALPTRQGDLSDGVESAIWDTMRYATTLKGDPMSDRQAQKTENILRDCLATDQGFAKAFVSCGSAKERYEWLLSDNSMVAKDLKAAEYNQPEWFASDTAFISHALYKISKNAKELRDAPTDMSNDQVTLDRGTFAIKELMEGLTGCVDRRYNVPDHPLDNSQWTWRVKDFEEYQSENARIGEMNSKVLDGTWGSDLSKEKATMHSLAKLDEPFKLLTRSVGKNFPPTIPHPGTSYVSTEDSEARPEHLTALNKMDDYVQHLRAQHKEKLPVTDECTNSKHGRKFKVTKPKHAHARAYTRRTTWEASILRHQGRLDDQSGENNSTET